MFRKRPVLTSHTSYSQHSSDTNLSHPVLKIKLSTNYMCAQEVKSHIYRQITIASRDNALLYNKIDSYLILTLEYRGTVANLQAPSFIGTADWGLHMPALLSVFWELLRNPINLRRNFSKVWGCGEIARVSICHTQQI